MRGPEAPDEAYERGVTAGEIAARLAGHDKHFETINGSLDRVAVALESFGLQVQELNINAQNSARTVLVTAAALKDAEEARRSKIESSWSPLSRTATALGALTAIASLLGYLAYVRG